mmetsp:Transcript_4325/g.10012  ORF Transcript_4325/g.10012 Transcript_4325/m.10012 type:complete len:347 (+) Transcript_4325:5592-6632(+)
MATESAAALLLVIVVLIIRHVLIVTEFGQVLVSSFAMQVVVVGSCKVLHKAFLHHFTILVFLISMEPLEAHERLDVGYKVGDDEHRESVPLLGVLRLLILDQVDDDGMLFPVQQGCRDSYVSTGQIDIPRIFFLVSMVEVVIQIVPHLPNRVHLPAIAALPRTRDDSLRIRHVECTLFFALTMLSNVAVYGRAGVRIQLCLGLQRRTSLRSVHCLFLPNLLVLPKLKVAFKVLLPVHPLSVVSEHQGYQIVCCIEKTVYIYFPVPLIALGSRNGVVDLLRECKGKAWPATTTIVFRVAIPHDFPVWEDSQSNSLLGFIFGRRLPEPLVLLRHGLAAAAVHGCCTSR